MKSNLIREMIDYSQTRGEKRMSRIEARNDFVKTFINVFNGAFESCLLFHCKVGCCKLVGDGSWCELYSVRH